MKIKTALISVADKTGLAELAAVLHKRQVVVYSTGGTLQALQECGIEVQNISSLTQFDEILDGRVKTLHPHVHAAILADTDNPAHVKTLEKMKIPPLDLVVVNFYPFEDAIAKHAQDNSDAARRDIIENIDIGGPTMVRAAAKNGDCTAVLTDPLDYPSFIGEMEKNGGDITPLHLRMLAAKAFVSVARLDAAIANYFSDQCAGAGEYRLYHNDEESAASENEDESNAETESATENKLVFPPHRFLHLHKQMDLRYGENPYQQAACYQVYGGGGAYAQLQGGRVSYNNLLDAQAACELAGLLHEPAAVIIKHNNPCGAASADSVKQAFYRARRCDPESAYGGVAAINREMDGETAEVLSEYFLEAVLAPQFSSQAKEVFAANRPALRLLLSPEEGSMKSMLLRSVGDWYLAQTPPHPEDGSDWKVVSRAQPTQAHWRDLQFAWRVAMVVKSNAIVLAKDAATIGIGAGQMSRADSARLACQKAARAKLKLEDSAAASDAFFPFADGVDELLSAGVRAIIQPGGSIRDAEVIDAVDKVGAVMVFTGCRHFRH